MRPILLKRLYVALAVLFCLGGLAGFARLWPSLGRPFGGFIWQFDNVYGHSVNYDVPQHWPGPVAGLTPHMSITAIDGKSPWEFADVYATAQIGQIVTYTVLTSAGERRSIAVPVTRFDLGYLIEAYGPLFLVGVALIGAGYILLRSARDTGRVLLGFIMLFVASQTLVHTHNGNITTFYNQPFFLAVMGAPPLAVLAAMLCHLGLIYPHRSRLVQRFAWLVPLCYGIAFVLGPALGIIFYFGANPSIAHLQPLATAGIMCFLLVGVGATLARGIWVIVWQRSTLSNTERRQIKILGVAWIVAGIILVGTVGASLLRLSTPFEPLVFLALSMPIALVYAIRNADLIADLEAENALRGDLLEDIQEVHRLQERILSELADELHESALAESKALEMHLFALLQGVTMGRLDSVAVQDEVASIHEQSLVLTRTLRQTVEGAKPVDFTCEGLITALERVIIQLNISSSPTRYTLQHKGAVDDCPLDVKREVYWIIRAALNNVRDHAQARHCTIQLVKRESIMEMVIDDDGRGTTRDEARSLSLASRRRLGIPSMRARAERLGGHLELISLGRGTQVQATIPLKETNPNEEYTNAPLDR
jgi:signal transduction histidine kinase